MDINKIQVKNLVIGNAVIIKGSPCRIKYVNEYLDIPVIRTIDVIVDIFDEKDNTVEVEGNKIKVDNEEDIDRIIMLLKRNGRLTLSVIYWNEMIGVFNPPEGRMFK